MRIIDLDQRCQEWHDWRGGKDLDGFPRITATTAAVVSGRSKWKSPWKLWMELTGRRPPDAVNPAMMRGTALEPQALSAYEGLVGFFANPVCIEHDTIPWAAASLDGLNEERKILVEIKCPGTANHQMALSGVVPPMYWAQMQWQLFCCGEGYVGHYWSYDGQQGKMLIVHQDVLFQQQLFAQAEEFRRMLVEDRPPAGNDWLDAARRWRAANEAAAIAKSLLEIAAEELKKLAGEQEKFEGGGVLFTKYEAKGSVDYDALLKDAGITEDTVEKYRKPSGSRTRISATKDEVPDVAIVVTAAVAEELNAADAWW